MADFLFGEASPPLAPKENAPVEERLVERMKDFTEALTPRMEDDAGTTLVFDIETGPLSDDELDAIRPDFDRESVQNSRWKAETLEKKRDEAAARWVEDYRELAPLSPITGRVLAIGYANRSGKFYADEGDEADIIDNWLSNFCDAWTNGGKLIGFNILGFDVPFILRRAWKLGLFVPYFVQPEMIGRCKVLVDLLDVWKCGSRYGSPKHVDDKLDTVARFFGLGGKLDGVTGADFHRLYHGTEEEKAKALEYLTRDVEITFQVAKRMGVIR